MPFKSRAQQSLFWAKMPKLAAQWQAETPKGMPLPQRLNSPGKPQPKPKEPSPTSSKT